MVLPCRRRSRRGHGLHGAVDGRLPCQPVRAPRPAGSGRRSWHYFRMQIGCSVHHASRDDHGAEGAALAGPARKASAKARGTASIRRGERGSRCSSRAGTRARRSDALSQPQSTAFRARSAGSQPAAPNRRCDRAAMPAPVRSARMPRRVSNQPLGIASELASANGAISPSYCCDSSSTAFSRSRCSFSGSVSKIVNYSRAPSSSTTSRWSNAASKRGRRRFRPARLRDLRRERGGPAFHRVEQVRRTFA